MVRDRNWGEILMQIGENLEWAQEVLEHALENQDELNDFEEGFVVSYLGKLMDYGEECFISEGQLEVINRLAKYFGFFSKDWEEFYD